MPDHDDTTGLSETAPVQRDGPSEASPSAEARSAAVSLMITRRQKAGLQALGFKVAEIREMTPAEAHAHLGL